MDKRYLLMQVNDSVFPIGGYTQSYGLETYILKDVVKTADHVTAYIGENLHLAFAHTELLAASLAYDYATAGDMDKLAELDEILSISKVPQEIREASHKLGGRFVKTVETTAVAFETTAFSQYAAKVKAKEVTPNHAVAYGVFCASLQVEKADALSFFLYSATSAMVTNAVKTIPLSQTQGQQILYKLTDSFPKLLEKVENLNPETLCMSLPALDIRCMQHECLYSRLYMS
ncbi:MAG: urease accessory protein UreF [Eubacteriales bacterium]